MLLVKEGFLGAGLIHGGFHPHLIIFRKAEVFIGEFILKKNKWFHYK